MKNLMRNTNWLLKSSLFEDIMSLILISGIILCLVAFPSLVTF